MLHPLCSQKNDFPSSFKRKNVFAFQVIKMKRKNKINFNNQRNFHTSAIITTASNRQRKIPLLFFVVCLKSRFVTKLQNAIKQASEENKIERKFGRVKEVKEKRVAEGKKKLIISILLPSLSYQTSLPLLLDIPETLKVYFVFSSLFKFDLLLFE